MQLKYTVFIFFVLQELSALGCLWKFHNICSLTESYVNNQGPRIPHLGISPLCFKSLYGLTRCIGQDSDRNIEINGKILNGGNHIENWLLNIGRAKGIFLIY